MNIKRKPVDKVRASRDGHEYHEIWVARKSLELLNPNSDLEAISIEGLSPIDQNTAKSEEVEIADVTLYYNGKEFSRSSKVSIIQFKYSVAYKNISVKASDIKKTIQKFADTYRNHLERHGTDASKKLNFQYITNRPIYSDLQKAINNIAFGTKNTGKFLKIENQFKVAAKLKDKQLKEFAGICKFSSYTQHLATSKDDLENILISLSATSDSIASSRLGKIKDLVRNKAGTIGDGDNIIDRTDVFAALNVRDINELLPCPEVLSNWGDTLIREQNEDAIKEINISNRTILIHAAGGVGKTVFMKSLAEMFSKNHEVIFFDSFGGGSYRSLVDARHLAKHGLIHIANTLAFRCLCDPILPNTPDDQTLAKTFRHRLEQCLDTLKTANSKRKIYIFVDAIDNAEFAAKQNGEIPFSKILLESFHDNPISGVKLIVSTRTERKPKTYAKLNEFKLKPFSKNETESFLKARLTSPTSLVIDTAFARSCGNARVLEYLTANMSQIDEINKSRLELDDLLTERIESAIESAIQKGSTKEELTTFLSGLTLLAPPVCIDDYALANKVDKNAIESMVSDLAPLLELNKHGVTFKDEPTETLVIKTYGAKVDDLKKIASNLSEAQEGSVFAAKTLPELLYKLDDSNGIYSLANDTRLPSSIESDVGKLRIKYARLRVAVKYAAEKKDYDKLIGFLVQISTIIESDHRGVNYLLNSPQLVVALNDADAVRRIYETKTKWPGTWHSRLGVIHILRGDLEEAHSHVYSLHEWVDHYLRSDHDHHFEYRSCMDESDCAVEPLFMLAKKSPKNAAKYFSRWKNWFSFKVASQFYQYITLALENGVVSKTDISVYLKELNNVGAIVATLHSQELSKAEKNLLLKKLVILLRKSKVELPDTLTTEKDFLLQKCFLYASLESHRENKKSDAMTILNAIGDNRPRVYAFKDRYYHNNFPVEFLLREVIRSIILKKEITYFDLLPGELHGFGKGIKNKKKSKKFIENLKSKIEKYFEIEPDKEKRIIRESDKEEIKEFLNNRLPQLHLLAEAIKKVLLSSGQKSKKEFNSLVDTWESISKSNNPYYVNRIDNLWIQFGYEVVIFCLFTLKNHKEKDFEKLLNSECLNHISVGSKMSLIQAISILIPNSDLNETVSSKISKQIEMENDVATRAGYFSDIAECLYGVNKDEAIEYFKKGLLAVDAIGSGDYRYLNELLIFTASLHGEEIDPSKFHSLNNICELNMSEEPQKFYWEPYGAAFSKIAGMRGLAQLSRWDDRQKISLDYTLLPNLIALVRDKKITPKDAIALNYIAAPRECRSAGTSEFVDALPISKLSQSEVKELIRQFFLNNSGVSMCSTVNSLAKLSEKVLGVKAQETIELKQMYPKYKALIDKSNNHSNLHSSYSDEKYRKQIAKEKKELQTQIARRIGKLNPSVKSELKKLLESFKGNGYGYEMKDLLFNKIRKKIDYRNRKTYIENLSSLEEDDFHWYWILEELSNCYKLWGANSVSLKKAFKVAGLNFLHQNFSKLVDNDYLSRTDLEKISNFSGVSIPDLALEVIKFGAQYDSIYSGAVWLSLATLLNEKASDGVGQKALISLLDGEASSLGELAEDGEFKPELYPDNNANKIIASLLWKTLGSHNAKDRWRATHSIRCFAKFNRWDVINEVVNLIDTRDSGAFQCSNIKFYDYHARLWLLISLARTAIDYPRDIANYKTKLMPFMKQDHVLYRHFAAKAMLECYRADSSFLTDDEAELLGKINVSSKPIIEESSRRTNSYVGRPKDSPKPPHKFYFEYDFRKMKLDSLGDVFNIDCWKMDDLVSESAFQIDADITGHTDKGNKSLYRSHHRSSSHEDTYGDQVAWHALHITAGKLLATHSTTKNYWGENSWDEWLSRYTLTRNDGYWKSDELDLIPLEIKTIIKEENKKKLVLPENKNVLLELIGVKNKLGKNIIVDGHWSSKDGIDISISSALIQKKHSRNAITSLSKKEPFQVWLPVLEGEDESDRFGTQNEDNLLPWIVSMQEYKKIDEFDPYSADTTRLRSKPSEGITKLYSLSCSDQFKRYWNDINGRPIFKAEMWKGPTRDRYDEEYSGNRLICSANFLKKLLKDSGSNLVILIQLRQYVERGYGRSSGEFFHSIGIVEINENLEFKYRKGCNVQRRHD